MLKTAVIGVGYLGRFHAQKYAMLPGSELVSVVDIDPEQGQKVADELEVSFFLDFHEVLDQVDAVSIVVPTVHHYEMAKAFIEKIGILKSFLTLTIILFFMSWFLQLSHKFS